jgi:hypothetical protein
MRKNYILFFFLPLFLLLNCQKNNICKPDWIKVFPEKGGQVIVDIKEDTILFTDLCNYSHYRDDLDALLQSDSVLITSIKEWDFQETKNYNKLVFDSLTYLYSSINGDSIGLITNYIPRRDFLKFLEINCCSEWKLALIGCKCKYELCSNYNGYRIVLSYYKRHFKEESHPQKLSILFYKNKRLIIEQKIINYNKIQDGYIQYFTTSDAIYFYHYYSDEKGRKAERVLAKFSFAKMIKVKN